MSYAGVHAPHEVGLCHLHLWYLADVFNQSNLYCVYFSEERELTIIRCRYSNLRMFVVTIARLTHSFCTTQIDRIRCCPHVFI